MGYTRDTIEGISWVGTFRIITRFLSLIRTSILARIFTPSEFGLYGIASLALSLLEIVAETGINVLLIQQNSVKRYINTAWIVSILRGAFISLFILLLSPFVAQFFNASDSIFLLLLISIVPFIRGFINPAIILYQKELMFKNEFYFRFFIFLVESIAIVFVAKLTGLISSIIIGLIVGSLLEVMLSFIVIKMRPVFKFEHKVLREILSRGKWVTMGGIFNYLFHNIDDVFVGRILGTSSLGLYQMAYKFSILPITEISDVVSKVAFPVYVKIANDRYRLRTAFLKTLAAVSVLSLLFGAIFIGFTKEIVLLVLGEKWIAIVPFLKILVVFGVVRGISGSSSALFLAVGKQQYISVVTFASFFVLISIVFPFISFGGLIGVSMAVLIASLVVLPIMAYYTFKVLYG